MSDEKTEIKQTNGEEQEDIKSRIRLKKQTRRREIRGWVLSVSLAVLIALTLRFLVFEFIRVDGPSMQPTLMTNEFVFMEKVTYRFEPPKRGDIIVCSFPNEDGKSFIKRVIGIPGDTLKIEDGVLYLNGEPNNDYYKDYIDYSLSETTVPDNCVFVMGDNRNDSKDSRFPDVGPIQFNKILGKAVFIAWPPGNIHGL